MATKNHNVTIVVDADTSKFQQKLSQAIAQAQKLEQSLGRMGGGGGGVVSGGGAGGSGLIISPHTGQPVGASPGLGSAGIGGGRLNGAIDRLSKAADKLLEAAAAFRGGSGSGGGGGGAGEEGGGEGGDGSRRRSNHRATMRNIYMARAAQGLVGSATNAISGAGALAAGAVSGFGAVGAGQQLTGRISGATGSGLMSAGMAATMFNPLVGGALMGIGGIASIFGATEEAEGRFVAAGETQNAQLAGRRGMMRQRMQMAQLGGLGFGRDRGRGRGFRDENSFLSFLNESANVGFSADEAVGGASSFARQVGFRSGGRQRQMIDVLNLTRTGASLGAVADFEGVGAFTQNTSGGGGGNTVTATQALSIGIREGFKGAGLDKFLGDTANIMRRVNRAGMEANEEEFVGTMRALHETLRGSDGGARHQLTQFAGSMTGNVMGAREMMAGPMRQIGQVMTFASMMQGGGGLEGFFGRADEAGKDPVRFAMEAIGGQAGGLAPAIFAANGLTMSRARRIPQGGQLGQVDPFFDALRSSNLTDVDSTKRRMAQAEAQRLGMADDQAFAKQMAIQLEFQSQALHLASEQIKAIESVKDAVESLKMNVAGP